MCFPFWKTTQVKQNHCKTSDIEHLCIYFHALNLLRFSLSTLAAIFGKQCTLNVRTNTWSLTSYIISLERLVHHPIFSDICTQKTELPQLATIKGCSWTSCMLQNSCAAPEMFGWKRWELLLLILIGSEHTSMIVVFNNVFLNQRCLPCQKNDSHIHVITSIVTSGNNKNIDRTRGPSFLFVTDFQGTVNFQPHQSLQITRFFETQAFRHFTARITLW